MKVRLCVCWVVACVFAMLLLTLTGCKSADTVAAATGSGSDLSGPPVFNARFQTREPRKCSQVKSPPNVSQAIALIQCQREHMEAHNVWLTTDVKAEMGSARDFIYRTDQGWPEIDTSAKLIPLRGSWTVYNCAGISRCGICRRLRRRIEVVKGRGAKARAKAGSSCARRRHRSPSARDRWHPVLTLSGESGGLLGHK